VKSLRNLRSQNAGCAIVADDILEFHASRLLLLIRICGTKSRTDGTEKLDGLTKMAKLDFFVRYPVFFGKLASQLDGQPPTLQEGIESSMVRFHYGPWDRRYYHVLAYLRGKQLVRVETRHRSYRLGLTSVGRQCADRLLEDPSFGQLASHMRAVNQLLGKKSGSTLKRLIYEVFDKEVAQLSLGERIS